MPGPLPPFPPPFELGTIRLRSLVPDDVHGWFVVLTDPRVIAQTSYDMRSPDAVARMIDHYRTAAHEQRFYRWAIASTVDNHCLGTCGFYRWDPEHHVAQLGYELAYDAWGQGVMTRTVGTILDWAFQTTPINRIQATVMVGNAGSARVIEKHGFHREGTLREYLICRSEPRDFWIFSLLRRERSGLDG